MSSHRVQPELRVVIRRFMTNVITQLKPLVPIIQKAMEAQREQRQLMPLWSPDPPSVPKGHVWTLPQRQLRRIDGTALAPDRIVIRDLDGNAIDDFSFSDRLCPICGDPIVGGFVWMENGRQVHMACSQMIATIRRNKTEEES